MRVLFVLICWYLIQVIDVFSYNKKCLGVACTGPVCFRKEETDPKGDDRHEPPLLEVPTEEEKKRMREEMEDREEERNEEEEAKKRQTFDPINKVYDDRKRRVTDLQECSRVTLPKPLLVTDEAMRCTGRGGKRMESSRRT